MLWTLTESSGSSWTRGNSHFLALPATALIKRKDGPTTYLRRPARMCPAFFKRNQRMAYMRTWNENKRKARLEAYNIARAEPRRSSRLASKISNYLSLFDCMFAILCIVCNLLYIYKKISQYIFCF